MADQPTSQTLLDGLRASATAFQAAIEATPPGRERSLALTYFEHAVTRAERAITSMRSVGVVEQEANLAGTIDDEQGVSTLADASKG